MGRAAGMARIHGKISDEMKVFVFDLLAYGEQLEHLKIGNELPYPLPRKYFKPEVAARTYAEHLEAWEELDRLGYDGVGFNEHHCSPYGLMNSPNLLAAAVARRTKRLKLLIYGNLLPLHEPLRGRGTRNARLHVERPADLGLCPRYPARIPGPQRAAGAIPRPLRGGVRHHPQGVDRGSF